MKYLKESRAMIIGLIVIALCARLAWYLIEPAINTLILLAALVTIFGVIIKRTWHW